MPRFFGKLEDLAGSGLILGNADHAVVDGAQVTLGQFGFDLVQNLVGTSWA
jgi:hypothetical protein